MNSASINLFYTCRINKNNYNSLGIKQPHVWNVNCTSITLYWILGNLLTKNVIGLRALSPVK